MIFKILKLIIFISIIWYLSEFFSEHPGVTSISWMEWGIQIPTDRFILIIILFSVVLIFVDRIWLAFMNLPKATFRRFEANNNKKVEQKLVKAFLLASHGEFESAAKEAALVSKNTKDKNLGKLLNTHLDVFNNLNKNSNNGEELSKNYFKRLTDQPSTAFVGHLALMRQAIFDKKDLNEVINEGVKALKFEPNSKQILEVLLFSHAKLEDITNSLIYLHKLKKMNYLDDRIYKNIFADLNYLKALEYLENEKSKFALKLLKEAFKLKPRHIEVSIKLSDLVKGIGSKTKSINQLEKTFLLTANPDVLKELSNKWNLKTSGSRVSKAINLLNKKSPENIKNDLKIEVASFAISEEIWGEAEKLLKDIPEDKLTNKAYQALADIAGSQNNSELVKINLEKAASAIEGCDYFCYSCGYKNHSWELHCQKCGQLSTIDWINPSSIENSEILKLTSLSIPLDSKSNRLLNKISN